MKGNVRYHLKEGRNPQVLYLFLLAACCFPVVSAPGALLLGLIFSLFIGTPFKDIADKWSVYLLKTSVIGFGFGIDIQVLLIAGKENIGVTSAFVRSEEHTSEIQSLMRISYAVFCLKKQK